VHALERSRQLRFAAQLEAAGDKHQGKCGENKATKYLHAR
jgi:hypothetical protein